MFDIPIVEAPERVGSRRKDIMLCYPYELKRLATWKAPYIIQPKLDGVRCRAIIASDSVTLISSEGHTITQVPHINEALKEVEYPVELDGELYCHGMNFQQIISRTSRSKNKHDDSEKISFHIFDIVAKDIQIDRIAKLNKEGFFVGNPSVQVVPSSLVRDEKEVMEFYAKYLDEGYEGFILRDSYSSYWRKRFSGIMKFKPHQRDDYTIVGVQEEISITGMPKNSLGAFMCVSDEGTVFNVGTGLTEDQRIQFWKHKDELVGKQLKVKYQSLTAGKGVPRFPVFLEVIGG